MLFTTLCFRGLFECTALILAFTWVAKYPGGRTSALPLHISMLTVQLCMGFAGRASTQAGGVRSSGSVLVWFCALTSAACACLCVLLRVALEPLATPSSCVTLWCTCNAVPPVRCFMPQLKFIQQSIPQQMFPSRCCLCGRLGRMHPCSMLICSNSSSFDCRCLLVCRSLFIPSCQGAAAGGLGFCQNKAPVCCVCEECCACRTRGGECVQKFQPNLPALRLAGCG